MAQRRTAHKEQIQKNIEELKKKLHLASILISRAANISQLSAFYYKHLREKNV